MLAPALTYLSPRSAAGRRPHGHWPRRHLHLCEAACSPCTSWSLVVPAAVYCASACVQGLLEPVVLTRQQLQGQRTAAVLHTVNCMAYCH